MPDPTFLDLLYAEAPRAAFDDVVARAEAAGASARELDRLREQRVLALRVREQIVRQRQREAELSALYDTASDLTAIRDVDAILAAIVRRARQLIGSDITYLSLNDQEEGASYMKVADGSVSAEFRNLRLPLGTGLLGLVAQTGAPYYTDDYHADERFVHRGYIDHAVRDENIRAILGVPLVVDGRVIGALLAGHRSVRAFPPGEVSLLTSFAAHAAVALENARLFEATQAALAEVDEASRTIRAHSETVEVAARAHDRLTDVLLHGGGVADVAAALSDVLDGSLVVLDETGRELAVVGSRLELPPGLEAAVVEARGSGRSVTLPLPGDTVAYVVTAMAGAEHLGTLVLHSPRTDLGLADRRTLERGGLVTALVLLFARTVAEAEDRVRGELLADLLAGRDLTRLAERARRQGAEVDGPSIVAVATVEGLEPRRAAALVARHADEHRGLGGQHDAHLVLVLPGSDPLAAGRALRGRLRAAGGNATVAVTTTHDAAGVGTAYPEAVQCLTALRALGRRGEVSDPVGLGVARLLLGDNGPEELDAFLTRELGPLLEYDERRGTELVQTLDAWFATAARTAEAARRLHIHANTVGQRLDRIGQLLGEGWREPARGLDLQLALRLWRLRQ